MSVVVAAFSCRSACSWHPSGMTAGDLRIFQCAGCGSEWARSEAWTPCDANGSVSAEVAAEAALRVM